MAYTYIIKVSQNLVTLNVTVTSVRCKNRLETEILFSRVYYQDFPTENVLFTKKKLFKVVGSTEKKTSYRGVQMLYAFEEDGGVEHKKGFTVF